MYGWAGLGALDCRNESINECFRVMGPNAPWCVSIMHQCAQAQSEPVACAEDEERDASGQCVKKGTSPLVWVGLGMGVLALVIILKK